MTPSPATLAHAAPPPSEPTCPNPCDPSAANSSGLFGMGHGVKPPRAIYQPDPSFSEPARKAKYQGTMTLSLIVDKDCIPQHIHVMSPLGAGLDEKAVQTVKTWKFHPAEKDGQPVAVEIAVEVDFHLY
jgi:periplasmic protein TonB